jgi:hypothetical protein
MADEYLQVLENGAADSLDLHLRHCISQQMRQIDSLTRLARMGDMG